MLVLQILDCLDYTSRKNLKNYFISHVRNKNKSRLVCNKKGNY